MQFDGLPPIPVLGNLKSYARLEQELDDVVMQVSFESCHTTLLGTLVVSDWDRGLSQYTFVQLPAARTPAPSHLTLSSDASLV